MYPIVLNLKGRSCLVVGGGAVATRKVKSLVEAEATVTVVATDISPELEEMATIACLEILRQEYQPAILSGRFLVIAATSDDRLNACLARDARQAGVLVNVVDQPDLCDFFVPAIVTRGALTLAVSTSGECPSLASALRRRLESEFGSEYARVTYILGDVRRMLKKHEPDGARRRQLLILAAGLDLAGRLRAGQELSAADIVAEVSKA